MQKQWQSRGAIFRLQSQLCAQMPNDCECELIDMRYPTPAVAAPTVALLKPGELLSRDVEKSILEVVAYQVSFYLRPPPITLQNFQ